MSDTQDPQVMDDKWEFVEGWNDGDPYTWVNTQTGEVVGDGGVRPTEAKDW